MADTDKDKDKDKDKDRDRGTGDGARRSRRMSATEEGHRVARRLLERHRGSAEAVIAGIADELSELRDERRDLRDELDAFKKPGVVTLNADDAKEYQAFKALNVKSSDLKTAMEELPTLRAKIAEHDRRTVADEAAPLLGWNAETLRALITDKGLAISFRDETRDGKSVKVPMVKLASDEKAQPVLLADYAKSTLSMYLPALTAKPAAGAPGAATGTPAKGTPMVEQSAGSGTAQNGGGGDGTQNGAHKPALSRNYQTPGQRAAAASKTPAGAT